MHSLVRAISERVVVLDGGLATELERRGNDLSDSLWSARLLLDAPDEIRAAHQAFFRAGAEVATTASYQASLAGFARIGADGAVLLTRSVRLAQQARDEHGRGWVAASIGPYGAVLADGSEYRGDYGLSVAELREFHRPRLEIVAAAGPDVLAFETIPCLDEVEALLAELEQLDQPAWLSLTCVGASTRAGEPVAEAFRMARDSKNVIAVGVNCTAPADVPDLVALARDESGKPIVAYPNSGEAWDAQRHRWTGRPGFTADQVAGWIAAGADLVGGCCRVGPRDIAAIVASVSAIPAKVPPSF
jgi:homocysteine S-methyltransferase